MTRMNKLDRLLAKLSFPSKKRKILMLLTQLSSQGVGIVKGLEEIENIYSKQGKKPREPLALMLREWRSDVSAGRPVSVAMRGWVSKSEELIIAAGEESNQLVDSFNDALNATAASNKIRAAILGALAYPAILFLMLLAALYGFSTQIVPAFATIVEPSTWTGMPATMYHLSSLVESYLFLGLGIFAGSMTLLIMTMPFFKGTARRYVEWLPPYNIYKSIQGAGFLLSVSGYLASGVAIADALRRVSANSSPYMRERVDAHIKKLDAGRSFGEAILQTKHNFPSEEIGSLMSIYSKHDNFQENLSIVTNDFVEETVSGTQKKMKALSSALLVAVFLTVASIAGTIFELQGMIEQATGAGASF